MSYKYPLLCYAHPIFYTCSLLRDFTSVASSPHAQDDYVSLQERLQNVLYTGTLMSHAITDCVFMVIYLHQPSKKEKVGREILLFVVISLCVILSKRAKSSPYSLQVVT